MGGGDSLPMESGRPGRASNSRCHNIMSPRTLTWLLGVGGTRMCPDRTQRGDLGGKVAPDWTPGSLGPGFSVATELCDLEQVSHLP